MKKVYLYAGVAPTFIRPLEFSSWAYPDRELFLKEYIDLIGRLSVANHSLKWWATDISSKNRFYSPVSFSLQKFLFILKALEADRSLDDCAVSDVPFEVAVGLRQALAGQDIEAICMGSRFAYVLKKIIRKMRRCLGIAGHVLEILPRWFWVRLKLGPYVDKMAKDQGPCYVIRSFVAKRSFDQQGKYQDIFFGCLPNFLKDKKRVVIFADIFGEFKETVNLISGANVPLVPLEYYLSPADIVAACTLPVNYAVTVPGELRCFGYRCSALLKEVCWLNDSKIQTYQFLHYFAMKRFLRRFTAETFLLTYENNPWEKMCVMAIKESSPCTKVIGYQHNVVPQASANMFISRHEEKIIPRPDVVLTVGEIPKGIIHRYETCSPSPMTVGCGLRFEYLFNISPRPRENRGHILLALEGAPEVTSMVNYVLDQIGGDPQCRLMMRTHPILPVENFRHLLRKDLDQVKNLTISKGRTLKEDLEWADIVIYWGSTVGLEALSMGKPVINFDTGDILSYDPLFDCSFLKWQVNSKIVLKPVIEAIYGLPLIEFTQKQKMAQEYMNRYFYRITSPLLTRFMI